MNNEIFLVVEHLKGQVADITYVMAAAARNAGEATNASVSAVLLGKDVAGLVNDLAVDRVLSVDHASLTDFSPDGYIQVLVQILEEYQPRAVLFGHSSIGMDLGSTLGAQIGLPVVSQCQQLTVSNGNLGYLCQICGGKLMAEGQLPEETTLITLAPGGYKPEEGQSERRAELISVSPPDIGEFRICLRKYIEPDVSDVDISKEQVLIAVGRGIQNEDNIDMAQELAEAVGGVVCASRPVIDQGWLPTMRMVGKSGKAVKPNVYIALGISGAPEHVEAITDSGVIFAVNTDATAPIFDVAKYGTTLDLFDIVPELVEAIKG